MTTPTPTRKVHHAVDNEDLEQITDALTQMAELLHDGDSYLLRHALKERMLERDLLTLAAFFEEVAYE